MNDKIIFLDTETTGKESHDRLCQVAWKEKGGELFSFLFKPLIEIVVEAMAVHHITNEMVADKQFFEASPHRKILKAEVESDNAILVAHNAKFDLDMLAKEGIVPKRYICTLKVARGLEEDWGLERFNLQYLRYFLGLDIDAKAHDAGGDVLVLEGLFEHLLKRVVNIEKMIDISSKPFLIKKFPFGKYRGRKIEDIAKSDVGYLQWLWNQKQGEEEPDEDWIHTLKFYLKI